MKIPANAYIEELDQRFTRSIYYADKMIIITHAARYGGEIYFALNTSPDPLSIIAIEINGGFYKALSLKEFASHIHASKLLIISCYLEKDYLYRAFRGHGKVLYFIKRGDIDQRVLEEIIESFISGELNTKDSLIEKIDLSR